MESQRKMRSEMNVRLAKKITEKLKSEDKSRWKNSCNRHNGKCGAKSEGGEVDLTIFFY